jgi:hypothetical protein
MAALELLLERLCIATDTESVAHDVALLLECHDLSQETCMLHGIPFEYCKLKKGVYNNPLILYQDLICELKGRGRLSELLEIMPFLDDYIEYYATGN